MGSTLQIFTTAKFSAINLSDRDAPASPPQQSKANNGAKIAKPTEKQIPISPAVSRLETLFQNLSIKEFTPLSRPVQSFVDKLAKAQRVIVLVGAGASVSAGIPDFRTPGTGLYSQLKSYNLPTPEAIFTISYFHKNPEPFRKLAADMWPGGKYSPTLAHYFIKLLNDKQKLLRVFTQNIDSLEHATGLCKSKIVAAHGNFDSASCVFTGKPVPVEDVREAYLNDTHDKLNAKHGTKLVKPDIVFFGESLPDRFFDRQVDFADCDLLLVMGTSLKVEAFASLIEGPKSDVPRMLVNREQVGTWRDGGFDFKSETSRDCFFQGDCDDGCLQLATALGWKEDLEKLIANKL